MPRERSESKATKTQAFYIDTNVALDYITGRNPEAVRILEGVKEKGGNCSQFEFFGYGSSRF